MTSFGHAADTDRQLCRSASVAALFAVAILGTSFHASAQQFASGCGPIENAYGPYDYRTDRDKLPIVEGAHFTPEVEALVRGRTGLVGGDIDYTLRAFPNHHRALVSMMKLGERMKAPQVPGAHYSVECYFDRALRFKPNDTACRTTSTVWLPKFSTARTSGLAAMAAVI